MVEREASRVLNMVLRRCNLFPPVNIRVERKIVNGQHGRRVVSEMYF